MTCQSDIRTKNHNSSAGTAFLFSLLIRSLCVRAGYLLTAVAMQTVRTLSLRVMRFKTGVVNRPFRRHATVMLHFAKVLRAHAQQRRAVGF